MGIRIRFRRSTARLRVQFLILGTLIAAAWLVEGIDTLFLHQGLNAFGVWPRQPIGLLGILFMPLLHGGIGHLAANTMPFLILGWLVMLRRTSDFAAVTFFSIIFTGGGLWLLGSARAVYIGASGIIFGYFGFLLLRGYFDRRPQSVLVALLVTLIYGGLIWGILPQRSGISWEAHLLGFLSGALAARFLIHPAEPEEPLASRIVIGPRDEASEF